MRRTTIFTAAFTVWVLAGQTTAAQGLSRSDCDALGHTMETLAQQNLRVQEIRREFSAARVGSLVDEMMTGNSKFAVEGRAIQDMLDAMEALDLDVKGIVPGIMVFRKLCRGD